MRHRKLDAPYGLDRKASWTDPEMIRFIAVKDELLLLRKSGLGLAA